MVSHFTGNMNIPGTARHIVPEAEREGKCAV
jgi:hypothetical protein